MVQCIDFFFSKLFNAIATKYLRSKMLRKRLRYAWTQDHSNTRDLIEVGCETKTSACITQNRAKTQNLTDYAGGKFKLLLNI